MLFAIDIDNTIAGGPDAYKLYIEHHNDDLGLGLSSQLLNTLSNYQSFLKLPQVRAYRREHEDRFQASRDRCRTSSSVILSLDTLPDAVTGVQYLSRFGQICYYTIRVNQEATKQWLAIHKFPNPQDVVFCDSALHKLMSIHQLEIQKHEHVALIDDRPFTLIQAFEKLTITHPHVARNIRQHVDLIAFGTGFGKVQNSDLRVFALPSWRDVNTLVDELNSSIGDVRRV
jgi:hypothetical protein